MIKAEGKRVLEHHGNHADSVRNERAANAAALLLVLGEFHVAVHEQNVDKTLSLR